MSCHPEEPKGDVGSFLHTFLLRRKNIVFKKLPVYRAKPCEDLGVFCPLLPARRIGGRGAHTQWRGVFVKAHKYSPTLANTPQAFHVLPLSRGDNHTYPLNPAKLLYHPIDKTSKMCYNTLLKLFFSAIGLSWFSFDLFFKISQKKAGISPVSNVARTPPTWCRYGVRHKRKRRPKWPSRRRMRQ